MRMAAIEYNVETIVCAGCGSRYDWQVKAVVKAGKSRLMCLWDSMKVQKRPHDAQ
jgi:hypothetical protein